MTATRIEECTDRGGSAPPPLVGTLLRESSAVLDRLTSLAARVLDAPVALVSLVESDRQVFCGVTGLAEPWATARQTPLSHSFCQYVVADRRPLVVEDARTEPRLADNLAIEDLGVVAYAGVPLSAPDGTVLGSFCAIDDRPRAWSEAELAILTDLAAAVESEIALRVTYQQLEDLADTSRRLLDATPDAYVALDQDGLVTGWNIRAEQLLGWTSDEVVGRPAVDLFIPERFRAAHLAGMDRVRRTGDSPLAGQRLEVVAATAAGVEIPVEMTITPLPGSHGVKFHAYLHDITDRKRRSEELLRERTFLEALLDSVDEAVVACDEDGRLALFNRTARSVHGVDQQPVSAEDWATMYALYGPDGMTALLPDEVPLARAYAGEVVRDDEMVIQPQGRGERRFLVNGRPIEGPDGQRLGAVVAMHEITERHNAEQWREAQAAFAEALTYNVPTDDDAMEAALAALGSRRQWRAVQFCPAAIAPGSSLRCAWVAEGVDGRAELASYADLAQEAFDLGRTRWSLSTEEQIAAGRPGRAVAQPVVSGDTVLGVLVVTGDRAGAPDEGVQTMLDGVAAHIGRHLERRRAERLNVALADQQAQFTRAIAQVKDFVWSMRVGSDGRPTYDYGSPNAEGIFGVGVPPLRELAGTVHRIIHPDDQAAHDAFQWQLFEGNSAEIELRILGFDGRERWVWTRAVPRRDKDGTMYVDGISTDVTERRNLAVQREKLLQRERQQVRELRELDRLKDEFLAMASHELRNPVGIIQGYADLLQQDPSLSEQSRRFLSVIDRRTRQLQGLVEELFDHAQIEAGLIELSQRPSDLDALVQEVVTGHLGLATEAGLCLESTLQCGRTLSVDASRLRQVLDNVVGNAIKYTPSGGSVQVTTSVVGPAAVIDVVDTGIGVSDEDLPRLFERLFRGETARAQHIAGTGLGLAVAKSLIQAHGGTIEAHRNEGGGTVFTIKLPLD